LTLTGSNFSRQGPRGVSCLKEMLAAEKTDHIFQFDCRVVFFFQLDKIAGVAESGQKTRSWQTDFQETDPANYLSLALDLGQRGVNVQSLAARLLLFPNAIIHISEHSLDLDSDTAALFLYGSMDSAKASKALIAQLQAQEPFVARGAAAHLLAEEMTEEAFRTLSAWGRPCGNQGRLSAQRYSGGDEIPGAGPDGVR